MNSQEVFQKHRQILLFAELVGGGSLQERIRNLAWILELLNSSDESWQTDELVILAEENSPFLPAKEILEEITKLRLLALEPDTRVYKLNSSAELHEKGLDASIAPQDCNFSVAELRDLLQGGSALRVVWKRSTLVSILQNMVAFGFHCIQSWQSLVAGGKQLDGVPFLWNVADDGDTTPMGDLPASSATLDIVRLAIEPLNFIGLVPTTEQRALVQWAFDRIYQKIQFLADGRAYYYLPDDDSYPNTAHPINDTQSRVIHLLIHLLREEQMYLDTARRKQARDSAIGLGRYLLSEQLLAPGEKYDGFWSFHKYTDRDLDGFQVLTINSELALKALEGLWSLGDENFKEDISRSITRVVAALRRTAIRNGGSIGWQKHFSTLESDDDRSNTSNRQPGEEKDLAATLENRACEIFATARSMLIFATATDMGLCDDGLEYIRGALQFVEQNWTVNLRNVKDDVEFIPYRTPELLDWSDGTFRITNPISAIVPYYLLKALRLGRLPLPIILTEPVNNCMNFALENYEGHGFWRDAATGSAYPTNTAFNMEMLMEYLRGCEV